MRFTHMIGWLGGVSLISLAGAASAQTAPQPVETASAPSQVSDNDIQDIVVTANKREQRLNDVGITVAVVSGSDLKNKQINNLADLAQTIPGLTFSNTANGTPVYTLRGVGFIETSIGAYPTVSTYLDEVALPFPVLSAHTAFDLERVEVLKGPQGTLFGQNATGGAINFIAAKPTNQFTAGGNISYGRFNQVIGDGYVSGPLSDTLKGRIAGRIERADGWQVSNSRPGDRNGKARNYEGRILLDYQPSSGAHFLLNLNGWQDKGDTQAPQFAAILPSQAAVFLNPKVTSTPFSPSSPRAADWTPNLPFRDNRLLQASLRGDFDLFSNVTLTSLTAYTDYKQRQGDDGDGLAAVTLDLLRDNGHIKSFSQELRLSNGASGPFRWVLGGNYERSDVTQTIRLSVADSASYALFAGVLGFTDFGLLDYTTDQKFTNYAGFGNVEYDILPDVTLKGGVRYTNAKTEAVLFSVDPTGSPTGTGPLFYNFVLGGAFGPYTGGGYAINNLPTTVNGIAPGAPGVYANTLHENNISWRVGLDWKPRPGLLLYANVAKGYKAGSFPTVSASVFSQYTPVTQESVQSYEAGFKASLLDRALQFNGAAFYYDYKDKQLRSKTPDMNFGLLDILQNIPKSSIKGFELEFIARPSRNFVVSTAFTYIDAKIDKFSGVNASGVAANFAGTRIPLTPKYQIGTNADWTIPLSDRYEGFLGASLNFRSDTTAIIGGDINPAAAISPGGKIFELPSYATLDLRAGIKSPDDKWRFSIWGKNITNSYYLTNVVTATDTIGRYTGMPATYGVSLGFKM
jgi:iron complex outermembrane receptor protein